MPQKLITLHGILINTCFRLLLLFIGYFGIVSPISAQTLTILDAESKEPLRMVTVSSEYPLAASMTDHEGKVEVADFKQSEWVEIRRLGYKTRLLSYKDLEALNFVLLLHHSLLDMAEVVVSATKHEQIRTKLPASVTSISTESFETLNPQTTADLLGTSGKVFIQKSQQGGGSPMIRGFATNRLLYAVDGVRMNTAIFRSGNLQNVISLDPFAMESTEILFGPGSVIYGSDAIGGVMAFQTLTPEFSTTDEVVASGQVATRYASANNEQSLHAHLQLAMQKWSFLSSISSFDYDHLRQGRHGPDDYIKDTFVQRQDGQDRVIQQDNALLQIPSGYHQYNLMQKVRFKPTNRWDLQYGLHYSETSDYGRYDRHNRTRNGLPRYGQWDYGPQKWMMNLLSAVHANPEGVLYHEMQVRTAWQHFEESRINRNLNSDEQTNRTEKVDAYSLNIDLKKKQSEKNTLYYGLEWVRNDVNSQANSTNLRTDEQFPDAARYPQAAWSSLAFYVHSEYEISDPFTLQAGLRYNHFWLDADFDTRFYPFPFEEASLNNGALVGSLGGVYAMDEGMLLRANFSTAFRSPNVDDIGKVFDSEPGAVVVPNPDLQAEYAYSADIGFAKVFNDQAKIDLSAYYTILDQALVRRNFQLNGQDSILYDGAMSRVQALQNAAIAQVYGIQLGVEAELLQGFGISADLNWQEGREEMDDGTRTASRHAAPLFGIARLQYKKDRLFLQVFTQFQAKRAHEDLAVEEQSKEEIYALDDQGRTYAPAWYTLNFSFRYELDERLSFSAGMENITDQRYRPYSSGLSGAGRNVNFSLRALF